MKALTEAKNFDHLLGLPGFSDRMLQNHFELYRGYVKKKVEIEAKLISADRSKANYSYAEISELHRRYPVAHNGVYLHELYFGNLKATPSQPGNHLLEAIKRDFGSLENWRADALSGVKSAQGWVLLCRSRLDGRLTNNLVEEHHKGILAGQDILLAIDCWEHAFMIDYGVKRDDYFAAVERVLDWETANGRFLSAEESYELAS